MKKRLIISLIVTLSLLLAGCSYNTIPNQQGFPQSDPRDDNTVQLPDNDSSNTPEISDDILLQPDYSSQQTENVSVSLSDSDLFSKKDMAGTYEASEACIITFTNGSPSISDISMAVWENDILKIMAEGTYVLSGKGNGVILVETTSEAKVQLVLNGLELSNDSGPAILVGQADKVFITLPAGTENSLSDGSSYTVTYDSSDVDACIISKDDLTINGTGSLTVTGNKAHGIVSKDDLVIYGATVTVKSASTAINGKDSLCIGAASVEVNAGTDGLKSSNDENQDKGYIYIENSVINARSSDKGIQAVSLINIVSGTITVNSGDDGIHSDSQVTIDGGNITVRSNDDGIHADYLLTVNGGTIAITAAEGMEATLVEINGGDITIDASDDGINAARKVSGYTPTVTINDGIITITMGQGDTDGIDSNGNIIINGGTVSITGNSSFDYDGQGIINGGTVIVNGSKVTTMPNQMMGGPGGGWGNQNGNGQNGNQNPPGSGCQGGNRPGGGRR